MMDAILLAVTRVTWQGWTTGMCHTQQGEIGDVIDKIVWAELLPSYLEHDIRALPFERICRWYLECLQM